MPTIEDFPGGSVVKNLPSSAEDTRNVGSIPGSGRSPGEGNGSSIQYSCLENLERGRLQSMGWQRVRHCWALMQSVAHTVWCYYMSSASLPSPLQAVRLLTLESYFLPVLGSSQAVSFIVSYTCSLLTSYFSMTWFKLISLTPNRWWSPFF